MERVHRVLERSHGGRIPRRPGGAAPHPAPWFAARRRGPALQPLTMGRMIGVAAGALPGLGYPAPMQALVLRQLTKIYKNGIKALKAIDLEVDEGDFFALLGPNGAGKTTAIGIVTSLVNKTSGVVEVFGHDIDRELEVAKSCIGLVPQEINFNQFETCFTIVVNQAGFYGIPRPLAKQRAEKYLKQLQLWDRRNSIARSLSGGMKRRLMIARALMHEPRLLILDEPTAGVDIEIRRSMWEFLRNINDAGTTIILTTHYLEEAENLCRNIAIIEGGNIIERDSMVNVLRKLQTEVFVFNLRDSRGAAPKLSGFSAVLSDPHTLEIEMSKTQSLNDIFAQLSAQGIAVNSMRNKVNRLEELFIRLVDGSALAGRAKSAAALPS
jgi:ABC-2 type transport system ATP-binding protein